jgi:hypothetical protein
MHWRLHNNIKLLPLFVLVLFLLSTINPNHDLYPVRNQNIALCMLAREMHRTRTRRKMRLQLSSKELSTSDCTVERIGTHLQSPWSIRIPQTHDPVTFRLAIPVLNHPNKRRVLHVRIIENWQQCFSSAFFVMVFRRRTIWLFERHEFVSSGGVVSSDPSTVSIIVDFFYETSRGRD